MRRLLPDGKRGKPVRQVVQGALARLTPHQSVHADEQPCLSTDPTEVEQLAQAIRQQAEREAQRARQRLWNVAREGDLGDPYLKALLLDVMEDYERIPDYYEALFRARAERQMKREAEDVDVIEGVAIPPPDSDDNQSISEESEEQ